MAKFEITWLEDRSDEAVLEEIRRVAALEPGRRLTKRVFDSHAKITSSAVERRFGSWAEATRKADLSDALPVYSDAAIIEDLKRVSDSSQNEPFTIAFYSERGKYSGGLFKRRFGGWREALEKAGLGHRFVGPITTERMKSQPGRAMSNEEILAQIRGIYALLGNAPLALADIEENSEITQNQMYRRFGSVYEALRQAGVEPVSLRRRHAEDEVFENLLNVWTHYGRAPTVSEMDRPPSTIGKDTYLRRYGRWRKALKAFVDRANSEADGEPALDPEQEPSTLRADPTESPTTGVAGMSRSKPSSQIGARPRVTRRAVTNVRPEDRRAPSKGLRFYVLHRDNFTCVLCGDNKNRTPEFFPHVDHIVPFSKGGKTRKDNLRTLCAACNIGRGNRFDD